MSDAPELDASTHRMIVDAIETCLARRGHGKTICPSEVARALWSDAQWRDHMGDVRRVAADMATDGRLLATQRGEVVDALTARGPIRLRRAGD